MKRPVNFDTIDNTHFQLFGNNFYTDLDTMNNRKEYSWVWTFCNGGGLLGDYVVLFQFKWEHDCYSMKKCVLGEGDTGDWIFQDNHMSKEWTKTKDAFVQHIIKMIDATIKGGYFQN